MKSVRLALISSLAGNYISVALQLLSTVIIARLLTPTEIGIYAVAAVLGQLAAQFRDFGMAEYLIQEKELSNDKIRAAFGVNILTSWTMAVLFFVGSWYVADFYHEPGIGVVMRIQTINFLLVPFGGITQAFFRREMMYRPIFIGGLLSGITSTFLAISLALAGVGYLSLAWASLAGLVVMVAVSIFYRPKDFPRWPGLKGMGAVVGFSKHAMGIYFLGQIGKGAPEAVIGKALDMASVAFFSRANGLMELLYRTVLRAILPVCLPYFAQEARAGNRSVHGYLKATTLVTGVGWPFFLFVGLMAFSAIRMIYGPQWLQSVQLAQILCIVAIIELPYWLATEVMIAAGRIDQSNRLQFVVQGARLVSLALVVPFGLVGACWGLAGAAIVGAFISHRYLSKIIDLRFHEVLQACAPSIGVALFSAAPAIVVSVFLEQTEATYIWLLIGCGIATGISWLGALKLFNHPLWYEIRTVVTSIGARFGRKGQPR